MTVLIFNSLLYVLTGLWFKKNYGMIPFTFLWFFYAFFSIFGVLIVWNNLYFEAFGISNSTPLDIEPYIYNYYCMLALSFPLRRLTGNELTFQYNSLPTNFGKYAKLVLLLFIVVILWRLFELSLYGNMGFFERHRMITEEGNGISLSDTSELLGTIAAFTLKLYQVFYPWALFFIFFGITSYRLPSGKALMIFAITLSPYLIGYYISGNRSGMFFILFNLAFFYYLFKPLISKQLNRKIFYACCFLGATLLSFSMDISQERFENSSMGTNGSILRYFGEVFPNLGYQYWDKVTNITYGARQFTSYFSIFFDFNSSIYSGFNERFNYWSAITGVDTALFKTIFGDLYIEFGTIGALVFVTVLSFILERFTKTHTLSFYNMPLFYYYFAFCTNMIFDFSTLYSSFNFLQVLIIIVVLGLYSKKHKLFSTEL